MPNPPDRIQEILAAPWTISDKIRALNADGYPRAEIARLLGKRYQYVRNVLEGDRHRRRTPAPTPGTLAPGVAEGQAEFVAKTYQLELGEDGMVQLPAAVLAALRLEPGMIIVTEVEADRLVMLTPRAAWAKVQAMAAPFAGGPPYASDELIAERRLEAERESRE